MFNKNDILRMKNKLKNKEEYDNEVKNFLLNSLSLSLKEIWIIGIHELSSQKYGCLFQKILEKKFCLNKISSRKNRGDSINKNNYFEIKCGRMKNGTIRLLQCRLYQKIDYYFTAHYDDKNDEMFFFLIPKKIMDEIEYKSSSHGSGEYKNDEYSINISPYMKNNTIGRKNFEKIKKYRMTEKELEVFFKNEI